MALARRSADPLAGVTPITTATAQEVRRDRRLRVLKILSDIPAGLSNEAVLKRVLLTVGHAVSTDLLRTELAWLHEQDLIELRQPRAMLVAQLTQRGIDVADGVATHPDIASPDV